MLSGIGQVSAYTIDQNTIPGTLGAHHKEMTITAEPGEIVYLPIPRQNFPVNMQVMVSGYFSPEGVSITYPDTYGPFGFSSSFADIQGGKVIDSSDGIGASDFGGCDDPTFIDASTAYYLGGMGNADGSYGSTCALRYDAVVIGFTQSAPSVSNRILLGIPNPSRDANGTPLYGPITFYVSVWY